MKIERCSAEIRFAAVKASHETLPSARPLADPHVFCNGNLRIKALERGTGVLHLIPKRHHIVNVAASGSQRRDVVNLFVIYFHGGGNGHRCICVMTSLLVWWEREKRVS